MSTHVPDRLAPDDLPDPMLGRVLRLVRFLRRGPAPVVLDFSRMHPLDVSAVYDARLCGLVKMADRGGGRFRGPPRAAGKEGAMSIAIEATASVLNAPAPAGPGTFERELWTLFRNLPTLCQEAGVHIGMLRRVVVKELVDNALDACGACRLGELPGGGYVVEDDGPGIGGIADEVGRLFSIRRPLTSSKLLSLPEPAGAGQRPARGDRSRARQSRGRPLRPHAGAVGSTSAPRTTGRPRRPRRAADPAPGTRVEVRPWAWHCRRTLTPSPGAVRVSSWRLAGTSYKGSPPHIGTTTIRSSSCAGRRVSVRRGNWSANWTAARGRGRAKSPARSRACSPRP